MRNEKGVFLVSSFLVLSVIGTFSLSLFLKNITLYRSAERAANRIVAFHQAESGLDQAIAQLRTNLSYAGQGYTAFGSGGGYEIQVEIPDPIGNPRLRRVTSTGHTPNNAVTSYAYERRQVLAYVDLSPPSLFNNSIFAKTSIEMSGNAVTDSYDSRTDVVGSKGNIGTNGTAAGVISLSGNTLVKGDTVVGPGGNVATAITTSGNSVIQGTKSAASTATVLDPVVIPSNLSNLGSLSVSGNDTVTLAGGTYWYSSIKITGNGKVNFTGPATVYVNGEVKISGNGIGTAQSLPPNLLIYVQGTPEVKLSGNSSLYGAIYAPDSEVEISGNGKLYGAAVGNTVETEGNARVRYDEALKQTTVGTTGQGGRVLAWTEG